MLTSLFGDLNIAKPGTAPRAADTVDADAGFAATAILETTAAEVNDRGQIVDRHVRDLFVTGSPAQAMRDHFATTRAEIESAGRWIVLIDPARIWASAVVKALSDASGQPVERLHLREQGTLRTLAMIERTAVVRRLDETLKIYHPDVRASGRENAEVSLALMERANMTAVIVGPMQPHAIDAMLNSLWDAVNGPTWRCPALLFLLPPGAVWIANKIAGIAWPQALKVHVLSESLTGASAVWNSILGTWNQVKAQPPLDPPTTSGADTLAFAAPAGDQLAGDGGDDAISRLPVGEVIETPSTPMPLDDSRVARTLSEMIRNDGVLACAIVDGMTGAVVARELRESVGVNIDVSAAACAQVLRAHRLAARSMGLADHVEEVVVTAGGRQQVIRTLAKRPELFMFALFDKNRSNVALARYRLMEAEKSLV